MLLFWRTAAARGSMKMVNKKGESRHPCLVPLCSVKGGDVSPLVITVVEGAVYKFLTQLINDSPKPNFCIVEMRNDQLALSKAFYASNAAMIVHACCDEKSIMLKSLRMLLDECVPLMKPV